MSLGGAIAVNAAIVGDRPTGLGVYALRLIAGLDGLGERLTVYTSRPDLVVAPRAEVRRVSSALRPERGARGHLRRLLWAQMGLRASMRQARPRVLLNLVPEGMLGPCLPQVTTVHDLMPLLYPSEYPRQQYYFRHYVPAVLRASHAVVAVSESTRRDLLRFYGLPPQKVRVVSPGCDSNRFSPGGLGPAVSVEPYLLYVGNVVPHKNLARLVEAFAAAAGGRAVGLKLRGWGPPRYVRNLQARIAALGLERQVDWQPYAADEELPALYRGARAFVLPSLYEGFGLTALEAMACGTPVVASGVSSLPEVVADAAVLVDPLDARSIAAGLEQVLASDPLCATLRERGLARARRFSWEATARSVQRVIAEAVPVG